MARTAGEVASRRRARGAALASALGLAVLFGGCGKSDDEQARAAIAALQQAFDAGDLQRVCAELSTDARRHVQQIGHGSPGRCVDRLREIQGAVTGGGGTPRAAEQKIVAIAFDGDSAVATVGFSDGARGSVPMIREDGEWRVDALYGGLPGSRQKDKY